MNDSIFGIFCINKILLSSSSCPESKETGRSTRNKDRIENEWHILSCHPQAETEISVRVFSKISELIF